MIFVIIYSALACVCLGVFINSFEYKPEEEKPLFYFISFIMALVFPIVILIWSGMKLSKKLNGVI